MIILPEKDFGTLELTEKESMAVLLHHHALFFGMKA